MKNMGFSHSPFKKLGFWASNVGNNSPAPSDRFHRLRHWLSRNFWNIKTLGWTNGKKAQSYFCILLLPIYLKLFGFRSPVMFCGFRFASHVTARAFEISVRRRRSGSWQLRYMERYFGVSTVNWEWGLFVCDYFQVYYIIADVRLKHEPVHSQRWKASVLVYPQIFFTGSWRTQYKHHLWTSIPAGNGLVTSDNVCIPTVPSGNLT